MQTVIIKQTSEVSKEVSGMLLIFSQALLKIFPCHIVRTGTRKKLLGYFIWQRTGDNVSMVFSPGGMCWNSLRKLIKAAGRKKR